MKLIFSAMMFFTGTALAFELTVVGLANLRGQLSPRQVTTKGGKQLLQGGVARLAQYVNHLRSASDHPVLVIDSGDMFLGSMESNTLEGAPVVDFYNRLGVDAVALGNLDFAFGPVGPQQAASSGGDPRGALKARVAQANFPFLSVNAVRKDNGQLIEGVRKSVVLTRGQLKIGVIGASSLDTPASTLPLNVADLDFLDPAPLIASEAARLRSEEKVDFVVVTYHEGEACYDRTSASVNDVSSCDRDHILPLIDQMPEGLIDVIVTSFDYRHMVKRYKGVAIIQPPNGTDGLAWVNLQRVGPAENQIEMFKDIVCDQSFVEPSSGQLTCSQYAANKYEGDVKPHLFLNQQIGTDVWVQDNIVTPNRERVEQIRAVPANTELLGPLHKIDPNSNILESPMGNWIADKLKKAFGDENIAVDFTLHNNGGLRVPFLNGPLTYGDIYDAIPFDNVLATISVDKSDIQHIVEVGLATYNGFSYSGLTYQIDDTCQFVELKINGQDVAENTRYTMGTNDFLASGGSGFADIQLATPVYYYHKAPLRDLVFSHLANQSESAQITPGPALTERNSYPKHCTSMD